MEVLTNKQRLVFTKSFILEPINKLIVLKPKDSKQEYGTDSYNRPGRATGPIGPSRAGWPGSSVQKQGHSTVKKNEQAILKRHCTYITVANSVIKLSFIS